ncbi:hypothetical protein Ddye_002850, partial [Dipteronia dyeriana]
MNHHHPNYHNPINRPSPNHQTITQSIAHLSTTKTQNPVNRLNRHHPTNTTQLICHHPTIEPQPLSIVHQSQASPPPQIEKPKSICAQIYRVLYMCVRERDRRDERGRDEIERKMKLVETIFLKFLIEVEPEKQATDGRPSIGPVYRSVFAKDGFPAPVPGMDSCWDIFRMSVEKYPNNPMLGRREIVDGKAGKYVWQTYKEVYELVIKVGNAIRSCGVEEGGKCGIYGANSPEWIVSMEACNAHGLYCVPLYDTLGAGAIEFIICHSEVSIAFVEEKKISE